jgi:hypothetical protein
MQLGAALAHSRPQVNLQKSGERSIRIGRQIFFEKQDRRSLKLSSKNHVLLRNEISDSCVVYEVRFVFA